MDATQFLLQLIGVTTATIGLSVLMNPKHYKKLFDHLEKEESSFYLMSFLPLIGGLSIVLWHNYWETTQEIVVSTIGWLAILKGVIRLLFPVWAVKIDRAIGTSSVFPFIGAAILALGGLLAWWGFMG